MKTLDHLKMEIIQLFPDETSINNKGHFEIGNVDLVDLAKKIAPAARKRIFFAFLDPLNFLRAEFLFFW